MGAEIKLVSISGTGFTGSQAAVMAVLVGLSGTNYLPVRVLSDGTLATSGA